MFVVWCLVILGYVLSSSPLPFRMVCLGGDGDGDKGRGVGGGGSGMKCVPSPSHVKLHVFETLVSSDR